MAASAGITGRSRNPKVKGRILGCLFGLLALAYGGLSLDLYLSQSRLVFQPDIGREKLLTPDQFGLPYEKTRFRTSDNVELDGWFIPAVQPRGTVLFLHGNAGNISHRLDLMQMFHELGYNALIFDFRGYGASSGTPSEQGTYRDAEAAWVYLARQKHIPPCRIALVGESLGGSIAAWLAAHRKPAALVIASSFTSIPDLAQHLYPHLPARWLAHIHYETREYLRRVNSPVLIAHSPADEIIPYEHGRALFAAANPPRQFLELAGKHNDGFTVMRETWTRVLGEFLGQQMARACER